MVNLGSKVRDTITGFAGVATGRSSFLNGCVTIGITPPIDKDGKRVSTEWFDESQVEVLGKPAGIPSQVGQTGGPRESHPPEGGHTRG